jgi:hypothetical protein
VSQVKVAFNIDESSENKGKIDTGQSVGRSPFFSLNNIRVMKSRRMR